MSYTPDYVPPKILDNKSASDPYQFYINREGLKAICPFQYTPCTQRCPVAVCVKGLAWTCSFTFQFGDDNRLIYKQLYTQDDLNGEQKV